MQGAANIMHCRVERQDLSRTYLAHHELESVVIIIIIIIIVELEQVPS